MTRYNSKTARRQNYIPFCGYILTILLLLCVCMCYIGKEVLLASAETYEVVLWLLYNIFVVLE